MKINDILNEDLIQEFDLIESNIMMLAERNGVDAEAIWEDLESLSDDELYVFAVTIPIMESQGVAEGSLTEFAPGGDGGNGPFDYGTAIIRIGEDYIDHWEDYPEGSGEDAADIIQVGKTFVSRGMQAGIAALFDLDTFVSDHVLDQLSDQGFNVKADIINKRQEVKLTSKEKRAKQQQWDEYQAKLDAKPGEWYKVTGVHEGGSVMTDIKATSPEEAKKEFLAKHDHPFYKGWKQIDAKLLNNQDQGVAEDWQKANKRDRTDGMSQKAVNAYRREHPGSKLKTAVTTKPSKLKKGSKASKRRKSYCSRSRGQMKMHNISCAKTPDKAICKARRRWNC